MKGAASSQRRARIQGGLEDIVPAALTSAPASSPAPVGSICSSHRFWGAAVRFSLASSIEFISSIAFSLRVQGLAWHRAPWDLLCVSAMVQAD